ncbi:MAG TPA: FHA domain-containing protein, partial [Tepidisphaeraceae bacterium]
LGLIGGIAVSLFIENVYTYLHGSGVPDMPHQLLARAVTWGVLGLFLAMAPGLVMRNFKKLSIGVVGGLLGGIVGGLLFDPVDHFTHNVLLARLVGTTTIGLVIGLSTGLIESVAKSGWLKVIEGLIAGKQFILYRNPTYIGSAPNCDIYLFKDHQVGRRHAAIHVVPGGFDLENLPLGSATLVNSQPIARARLKHGDQIQIGNTVFTFQEKARAKQRA